MQRKAVVIKKNHTRQDASKDSCLLDVSPKKSGKAVQLGVDDEEGLFLKVLEKLEEHDEFMDDDGPEIDMTSEVGDDAASDAGSNNDADGDERPPFETLTLSPKLADWELAIAWNQLRNRKMPTVDVAKRIIRDVVQLYEAEPSLLYVDSPPKGSQMIVVGDLHGHFGDLMHILEEYGDPRAGESGTYYLFNGDFVDRGAWGPEVLLCLYCLKLQFPQAVFMNRGNHEDEQQNMKPDNGFRDQHCIRAWTTNGQEMYRLCRYSFKVLPLAHVIGGEIFVVHGGLPLDTKVSLSEIAGIDRKHNIPVHKLTVHGYPKMQKVRAKKKIVFEDGDVIKAGTLGRLLRKAGKTNRAVVHFEMKYGIEEVDCILMGAPELEEELEIVFDSVHERKKQRARRIFAALLWSDIAPQNGTKQVGPNQRGAGSYFDGVVTSEFLKHNGLKLLLRSHEKRDEGYREEQKSDKGRVIAATIFSASNYPSGVGEPDGGNKASVVIIPAKAKKGSLAAGVKSAVAWRIPYHSSGRFGAAVAKDSVSDELRHKMISAQAETPPESARESARMRAMQQLRCMVYSSRPELLVFWQQKDRNGTGKVSAQEWASAMRACVVPDEDFPWEWLAQYMVCFDAEGCCHYPSFLSRYDNDLSRRLADRLYKPSVRQVFAREFEWSSEAAAKEWSKLDRDNNGRLSYRELKPLLRNADDNEEDGDRVYALLTGLDQNHNGYVERDEFMSAIRILTRASARKSMRASIVTRQSTNSSRTFCTQPSVSDRRSLTKLEDCWVAIQHVLRTLSQARVSIASIFRVLDEDCSGVIDETEFRKGLAQLLSGHQLLNTMEQWEPYLWSLIDEDDSGLVSPNELATALTVREIVSL